MLEPQERPNSWDSARGDVSGGVCREIGVPGKAFPLFSGADGRGLLITRVYSVFFSLLFIFFLLFYLVPCRLIICFHAFLSFLVFIYVFVILFDFIDFSFILFFNLKVFISILIMLLFLGEHLNQVTWIIWNPSSSISHLHVEKAKGPIWIS